MLLERSREYTLTLLCSMSLLARVSAFALALCVGAGWVRHDDAAASGESRKETSAEPKQRHRDSMGGTGKENDPAYQPGAGERMKLATEAKLGMVAYTELDQQGRMYVQFENAPPNLHSLREARKDRERLLERGDWLVVALTFWSVIDVETMLNAARLAATSGKSFEVGILTVAEPHETEQWCDESDFGTDADVVPQCMAFRNGKLLANTAGCITKGELEDFARTAGLRVAGAGKAKADASQSRGERVKRP